MYLHIKKDTVLKSSTVQSIFLPENLKIKVSAGTAYRILAAKVEDNHIKFTLDGLSIKGRNTWYAFAKDAYLSNTETFEEAKSIPRINAAGLEVLTSFEGCELEAYLDSVGVLTIGWGSTGPHVYPGLRISQQTADALLVKDLARFEEAVSKLVKVELTPDQFSALVSFTYNVGEGALAESTLLRLLNAGDYTGAAQQFSRWSKAGGQSLPGLVRRRNAEAALLLGKDYTVFL